MQASNERLAGSFDSAGSPGKCRSPAAGDIMSKNPAGGRAVGCRFVTRVTPWIEPGR
jgi:hypothetical protein